MAEPKDSENTTVEITCKINLDRHVPDAELLLLTKSIIPTQEEIAPLIDLISKKIAVYEHDRKTMNIVTVGARLQ